MFVSDFQQIDESKLLINIADADNLNYLVIFLTGVIPLPIGTAAGKFEPQLSFNTVAEDFFQVFTSLGLIQTPHQSGNTSGTSPTRSLQQSSKFHSLKNFTKLKIQRCPKCSAQVRFLTLRRSASLLSLKLLSSNKHHQQPATQILTSSLARKCSKTS